MCRNTLQYLQQAHDQSIYQYYPLPCSHIDDLPFSNTTVQWGKADEPRGVSVLKSTQYVSLSLSRSVGGVHSS